MPDASPHRSVLIVLAYLWPLALVPLFLERSDPDVRWHTRHGLVLMIVEAALLAAYFVAMSIVHLAAIGLGAALLTLLIVAWTAMLTVHVVAILKGIGGQRLIVPTISRYADDR